jgi:hypothetical protein
VTISASTPVAMPTRASPGRARHLREQMTQCRADIASQVGALYQPGDTHRGRFNAAR